MRNTLLMAAAAAALMTTPAVAQDIPATDTTAQPPSTDPIGTAPTAEVPSAPDAAEAVESVATPPADSVEPAQAASAEATASTSIVATMRAEGQFTTLLSALDAAGLTSILESDESISILAPTDAAFAALPAGELDRLMQPENREELENLLLYHVLNANVRADQIENRRGPVVTGSGAQILLDGSGGSLRADNATITNAQLRGSNGAVLVIDQVLSPDASLAAQGDEDSDAATTTEAGATAGADVEASADTTAATEAETAVEAGATTEAAVEAEAATVTETPATAPATESTEEEAEGEEMPSTPPIDEGEPTDEEDPATPQS